MQPEDGRVDVDVADLDQVLQPAEDVQHLGALRIPPPSTHETHEARNTGLGAELVTRRLVSPSLLLLHRGRLLLLQVLSVVSVQ